MIKHDAINNMIFLILFVLPAYTVIKAKSCKNRQNLTGRGLYIKAKTPYSKGFPAYFFQ